MNLIDLKYLIKVFRLQIYTMSGSNIQKVNMVASFELNKALSANVCYYGEDCYKESCDRIHYITNDEAFWNWYKESGNQNYQGKICLHYLLGTCNPKLLSKKCGREIKECTEIHLDKICELEKINNRLCMKFGIRSFEDINNLHFRDRLVRDLLTKLYAKLTEENTTEENTENTENMENTEKITEEKITEENTEKTTKEIKKNQKIQMTYAQALLKKSQDNESECSDDSEQPKDSDSNAYSVNLAVTDELACKVEENEETIRKLEKMNLELKVKLVKAKEKLMEMEEEVQYKNGQLSNIKKIIKS